ncbi:MAG TPA: hypothetical protein VLE22_04665, partial [Bryobacteraceae bacterium]|nr:hypothetical protein [Bryobacteraceae bacterium]
MTSSFDYEPLGRPEKVTEAGMRETNTVYDDENLAVLMKADLDTKADGKLTTVRHFDPLWRVRLERTTDGTPLALGSEEAGIKVQRRYRTVTGARYELASNPYRAATSGAASSEQTMGWTRTK